MSIRKRADDWFTELPAAARPPSRTRSPTRILKEIRERLRFLVDVGLDYLTLSRASGTLSGGESQRIRLASQIGSGLTGVLYVLDEPSIGLHQRDNARLLETLQAPARPRQHGDRRRARRGRDPAPPTTCVDIGPGAGIHGGEIVAEGTPQRDHGQSRTRITGKYLSGELRDRRCRRSAASASGQAPSRSSARAATT